MKVLFILCLFSLLSIAQDTTDHTDHSNEGSHGSESGFINEMEVGIDTQEGIVEIAHISTMNNVDSSVFLLPGTIYLAGHTGHFDTMGYDRFNLFLLNIINHHSKKYGALQMETGLKLLGVEQQPFGAEPGSSLKFLRLNIAQIEITSVVDLDDEGNKKIHFIAAGKFGKSKQNADLAAMGSADQQLFQDYLNCEHCFVNKDGSSWGNHQSFGLAVELEVKRLLVKTYAEINIDSSSNTIMNSHKNMNLNYLMLERKVGIEVEYNILNMGNAGHLNAFTSVEYYNLRQDLSVPNTPYQNQNKIMKDGLLFKIGLKYNLGTFRSKKKKKKKNGHH